MSLKPEDIHNATNRHNVNILLRSHNRNLSDEEISHIEKFDLITEKRDEAQYNVLHKKILNGFKLVDDGNVQGQL